MGNPDECKSLSELPPPDLTLPTVNCKLQHLEQQFLKQSFLLSQVRVTLGEYHLKKAEPLPSQNYRVTRAVVHPKFQFSPAADR